MKDKSALARAYARSILAADSGDRGIEAMEPKGPAIDDLLGVLRSHAAKKNRLEVGRGIDEDLVRSTIECVRTGKELNAGQAYALEAIIFPGIRPVANILNGEIANLPDGEFSCLVQDEAIYASMKRAIASVGCIMVPKDPRYPYAGTGFVVGKNLLMTNRHVARIFAEGVGTKGIRFLEGQIAQLAPRREEADAEDEPLYGVKRVVMIHPYYDMALLEIPDLPLEPLVLDPVEPEGLRTMVAVIGYPAFDSRNPTLVQNEVFQNQFYIKRIAPGYFGGRARVMSFDNDVSVGKHDSSTLGGNSGSCVVDAKTGHVLGLHFAGAYMKTNYCVTALDLSRDPRVVDAGVSFRSPQPTADNPASKRWADVESVSSTSMGQVAEGGEIRITVPIEITVRVGKPAS